MSVAADKPFHCSAILVAAGTGSRMGFDKLLARLGEATVLQRSLDALTTHPSVHSVVVVCPTDRWQTLRIPGCGKPVLHTTGGTLRQDSVLQGIHHCPTESTHIAIHDAARPLVSPTDLERVISTARQSGAASLAHRIVDTLKRSTPDLLIRESVSRDHLWGMETPQVFDKAHLLDSLDLSGEFTDEVSRLQTAGHPVTLVESHYPNPKITTLADLPLATALLRAGRQDPSQQ